MDLFDPKPALSKWAGKPLPETIGRPVLYSTTSVFLQHFGLNSVEDLPDLPDLAETEDAGADD